MLIKNLQKETYTIFYTNLVSLHNLRYYYKLVQFYF